ncbi:TonB-dependent receptor protein [Alteromonas infernus]
MRLPSLFPMSLFTTSLLTTMAAAQEANEIERIETTSSRIQGQITATGYAVSSISEEALSMLSFQHIQESLNYIAGAGVQRGNGQEYLPALRSPVLTGAGACGGILAAEDGIPLRAAGFCNINELFEAHGEVAERIDVIKGPASALYGSNAIHGVINVITPDTTQGTGQLALDYGSYGFHRAKLQQGKDFGSSGVGIAASLTRDTGYRNDEGVDQEKVSLRHRIEWDSTVITSGLTYTHLDQETAGYIEGFESYKSTELARSNPNPEAFRNAKSLRIWSKFNTSFDGGHGLSITPYLRNQDMRFRMHFLPGKPLEENAQKGVGVLSQFNYIVNDYVSLDIGIDAEYTEGELVQSQQGATEGSAFLVETIPSGKHYDYDVDAVLIAPFFALNWQHEKWDVSLGGRFESMQYDYINNMNVGRVREDGTQCGFGGCRYSRPADSSNDFDSFSPKLSLRYQLNGSTQLFGGLARGYRAPQATELYRLQRTQEVTEISDVLRVDFAGTYARHTYEHSQITGELDIKGNDMDTAPKVQLNTRLNYDVTRNIQAQIEWQHVASYYTDAENLNEYDGHDLVHARVRFNVNNDITLHARINNVFDTKYAERADFTSFTGPRYFPGRPRNFMLSATFAL